MALNYRPLQMGVPETTIGVIEWKLYKNKETWAEGFIVSVGTAAPLAGDRGRMKRGFEYWFITNRVEVSTPDAFWVKLVDVVQPGETNARVDLVAERLGDPDDRDLLPPMEAAPTGLDVTAPPGASMVWCRAQGGVAGGRCTSPKEGPQPVMRRASLRFVVAAAAEQQVRPTWYWWSGASPDLFGSGQIAQEGDELVFDLKKEPIASQSPWRCIGPLPSDPRQECGTAPVSPPL
jgi:hypothetical protein